MVTAVCYRLRLLCYDLSTFVILAMLDDTGIYDDTKSTAASNDSGYQIPINQLVKDSIGIYTFIYSILRLCAQLC